MAKSLSGNGIEVHTSNELKIYLRGQHRKPEMCCVGQEFW